MVISIEKAKISHWKQFLDEAGEGKLWKAATYMKPRDSWGCIPVLKVGNREMTDNREKFRAFTDSFFPAMAPPQDKPLACVAAEIPWQPISKLEIYRSLEAARSSTAPLKANAPPRNVTGRSTRSERTLQSFSKSA